MFIEFFFLDIFGVGVVRVDEAGGTKYKSKNCNIFLPSFDVSSLNLIFSKSRNT